MRRLLAVVAFVAATLTAGQAVAQYVPTPTPVPQFCTTTCSGSGAYRVCTTYCS